MSTSPPAGWYPDPNDPSLQRYWDGSVWTAHTHPASGSQAAQQAQAQQAGQQYAQQPGAARAAGYGGQPAAGQSQVAVTAKYGWYNFALAIVKPRIVIDGSMPIEAAWSTQGYPIPPGRHQVEVHFPWMFFPTGGANSVVFDVGPGQVAHVTYKAPWLIFMKGPMTVQVA